MHPVIAALAAALRDLREPRVLALALVPPLAAIAVWLALAWVFADDWARWVADAIATTPWLTWLSDWGDMVRSLINPAGEKETDLSKVRIDVEVFEAAVCGFLQSARHAAAVEVALMVDSDMATTRQLVEGIDRKRFSVNGLRED